MTKISAIDAWAKKLDALIPEALKETDRGLEAKFKSLLQRFANDLEIASREEFDIQSKVLLKTRLKLEALEQRLAALEAKSQSKET